MLSRALRTRAVACSSVYMVLRRGGAVVRFRVFFGATSLHIRHVVSTQSLASAEAIQGATAGLPPRPCRACEDLPLCCRPHSIAHKAWSSGSAWDDMLANPTPSRHRSDVQE